jgi:site-specific recombinase XerC
MFRELLEDWRVSLRARGRSLATIASYITVGESFAAHVTALSGPTTPEGIRREDVEAYLADMRDRHLSPATVAKHYPSLQQLFVWLVEEGEIPHSPMRRMKPPTVPEQPVPVLDDVALSALLASCRGNTQPELRRCTVILVRTGPGRAGIRALAGLRQLNSKAAGARIVVTGGVTRSAKDPGDTHASRNISIDSRLPAEPVRRIGGRLGTSDRRLSRWA